MSQNTCIDEGGQTTQTLPLPSFPSREAVEAHLKSDPDIFRDYLLLPSFMQKELVDFCMGKQGLKITYDTVFRKIFDPDTEKGLKRLESLLSAIMGRPLMIISVMPREGTQLAESASFVVMDVLVQLDDMSFANIEMQKIGYSFPLARADCYISDIIMRQYVSVKAELGSDFTFNDLHKVYGIILMEQSPGEFHKAAGHYIHKRKPVFDTGIYKDNPGLHEDIFLCLDSFHSNVHNVTKSSSELEAWLTFLSATDPLVIGALIEAFPCFAPIYQEIMEFAKDPKELIGMLSKELYIMDKNMERLMVSQLQEEVTAEKARADAAVAERDKIVAERDTAVTKAKVAEAKANEAVTKLAVFKLQCQNKNPEDIAGELGLSVEYVNSVLNEP